MFSKKLPLPDAYHDAWWAFLDCAEVIEGGRRLLLGTLPTGRVEPAPIGVGLDALARAIDDARGWMDRWRLEELAGEWEDCHDALHESQVAIPVVREVAATTGELEELLGAVEDVVAPLDAFADAERAFRRRWRIPRDRTL
ncbi:MAG: hypothetical protein KY457_06480 [Actinobacteria bacterium]|nr:hypothetical protein [Actinomycetota bacterium]